MTEGSNPHSATCPSFPLRYMNSFYVAISVYAGLGDSSMYAQNTGEYILMCVFCTLNVFMAAYILGKL